LTLFLIGIGGACGAVARYKLGEFLLRHEEHTFPFGTFLINISGALLLGLLSGFHLAGNPYFLLAEGFCGAFTTFSTFALEGVQLIRGKALSKAMLYVGLTVAAGLLCFLAGYGAAGALSAQGL
jgi:crcB protein